MVPTEKLRTCAARRTFITELAVRFRWSAVSLVHLVSVLQPKTKQKIRWLAIDTCGKVWSSGYVSQKFLGPWIMLILLEATTALYCEHYGATLWFGEFLIVKKMQTNKKISFLQLLLFLIKGVCKLTRLKKCSDALWCKNELPKPLQYGLNPGVGQCATIFICSVMNWTTGVSIIWPTAANMIQCEWALSSKSVLFPVCKTQIFLNSCIIKTRVV